tara:strand:+ start:802 stop:2181 length:1380 start_codon:yes stop_codon:yes gene_type:complete
MDTETILMNHRPPEEPDKQTMSIEALMEGCPAAFIDFYYLTTAGDGVADDQPSAAQVAARLAAGQAADALDAKKIEEFIDDEVDPEHMPFVRDALVHAESSAREGDDAGAQDAFRSIAEFFLKVGDPRKGIFFYEKRLKAARKAKDPAAEMVADGDLGRVYESMGDIPHAIAAYERLVAVAAADGSRDDVSSSRRHLIRAYNAAADAKTREGDGDGAVRFLTSALDVARKEGESDGGVLLEADANYRLGLALARIGEHAAALERQDDHLTLCARKASPVDAVGAGKARRALAASRLAMRDAAIASGETAAAEAHQREAARCLEFFLDGEPPDNGGGGGGGMSAILLAKAREAETEEESGGKGVVRDPGADARAWCTLGKIRSAEGEHAKAASCFEKFFELARGLSDQRLLDVARINLGIARGKVKQEKFMSTVLHAGEDGTKEGSEALGNLLSWKVARA